ncbi:branched-chain amino acid ABC transporter permease [Halomicrococcus sp. NG-SE-24]|uniref:branched-chain amino acid ABC transporter permease n=1 Tax=Halomicrococcus sp. NG-SE-24 TaxID=3436928 RepID=UPI003D97317D
MSVTDTVTNRGSLLLAALTAVIAALFLWTPVNAQVPGAALAYLEVTILLLLYILLVLGLNLQFGFTGLINFGHVAFFAVGAYTVAMLTAVNPYAGTGLGLPWPVGLLAGVITASVLGIIIGMSTLRLRDDFLAIATLAAAEIIHSLFVAFRGLFGAHVGILGIPQPLKEATSSSDTEVLAALFVFATIALLTYAGINRLTNAPYGRVLRAIRADELVTRALGKPAVTYKMQSFVYGAALAGFAGGLYALYNGAVSPGFFTLNVTVIIWIGMLLGGPGNNRAVIAGLAIIVGLRFLTRFVQGPIPVSSADFASLRLMVVGLVLVGIIRYKPEGIWGNAEELGVNR